VREQRQANCHFITYFLGQTRSAVFSLRKERKNIPQKRTRKAFLFLPTAEMLGPAPRVMHIPCAPQAPCDSDGSGRVSPGALRVLSPGRGAGLSPQTVAPLPCCVCPFCSCLGPSTPGVREGPCAPQHSASVSHIQAALCPQVIRAHGTM